MWSQPKPISKSCSHGLINMLCTAATSFLFQPLQRPHWLPIHFSYYICYVDSWYCYLFTIVYAKHVYPCYTIVTRMITRSKRAENGIGKNRIRIYRLFGKISSKLMVVIFRYSHIGAPLSCSKTFQGLFWNRLVEVMDFRFY